MGDKFTCVGYYAMMPYQTKANRSILSVSFYAPNLENVSVDCV